MLNRLFVVDSVTLTSTGTAVSSYTPWDQTTRKLPTQVVVKATGQGAYVRLSNDASAATNADVLVQGGDHVVLSVQGRRWVSVLSDGASSTVNVGALSTGVSGSAASLDLVFVDAGVLDPRVTFTRASTATYFNSAGVLTSAAINESRRDFDPATLAVRGLLIEEQRTNLIFPSEDFANATYTPTNVTGVVNAAVAPNGTTTADELVEDGALGVHGFLGPVVNVANATVYTYSIFAKVKAGTRSLFIYGQNTAAYSGVNAGAKFNVSGAVISTGTTYGTSTSSVQSVGNGWYRCVVTFPATVAANAGQNLRIVLDNGTGTPSAGAASYTGDGTSGFFVWGAQLEAGAFPTSYIPTTTTALTRSADVASVNTLSPWFNATEGTLFAEVTRNYSGNFLAYPHTASLSDGTNANCIRTGYGALGSQALVPDILVSSVNQLNYQFGTFNVPTAKIALAYKTNDTQFAFNSVAQATDTSCSIPAISKLNIGSDGISGSNNWGGWIRRITYYPRKLSSAELQAITTP